MRSVWLSLIWKEWHEHKWKLASIAAVLWCVVAVSMFSSDNDTFGLASGMVMMCMVPLAVFVGLSSAASERSRNTLPFMQSLPVPMWHLALTKLVLGLITVVLPVLLAIASCYVWQRLFDLLRADYELSKPIVGQPITGKYFLDAAIFGATVAASMYIWAAATGVNRKDEVSAAAVALSLMIGWPAILWLLFWLASIQSIRDLEAWPFLAGFASVPGGIAEIIAESPHLHFVQVVLGISVAVATHSLLATFYVRRFGQITEREIVSPKAVRRESKTFDWLNSPRSSPLSAIVWKQFRESGPIAVVGLAGVVALVLIIAIGDRIATRDGAAAMPFGMIYARVAIVFGFFVALVVGIGVSLNDVSPQLNTFWRSRPIRPDHWFWCKFVTGLGVVFASIYVPIALLAAVSDQPIDEGVNYPTVIAVPAGQLAIFAAAVATTCLVRHAVYAAVLSIAAVIAAAPISFCIGEIAVRSGWIARSTSNWWSEDIGLAIGFSACFAACTVLAWLVTRNDWGWRSRF